MNNKADKIKQKLTLQPKINPQTGLTPQQEECALLLATGEKVSKVAEKIQVARATIYQWADTIPFQCYLNQLRDEVQRQTHHSLFMLAEEALGTIRKALTSENENIKLKTAMWILERIDKVEVGKCNPFSALREEATYCNWHGVNDPEFHPSFYNTRLKEMGLVETEETKENNLKMNYIECFES